MKFKSKADENAHSSLAKYHKLVESSRSFSLIDVKLKRNPILRSHAAFYARYRRRNLLLFSSAVWLHSMIAATAIPTLLNSMRPDDDLSDLRGNSLTVVGASMPRSTNTRFTVSSVRSGGVLKKWTIFDGGCILFLLAIAGFRNLQRHTGNKALLRK